MHACIKSSQTKLLGARVLLAVCCDVKYILNQTEEHYTIACIPAYNEAATIGDIIGRCQGIVDVVVVCDDGSTDDTARIAEQLNAVVVSHTRNLGYGAALRSLFQKARELEPMYLVTLDGDGQHDPADIPNLLGLLEGGEFDVVIGTRFHDYEEDKIAGLRRWGIRLITWLVNQQGYSVSDAQSGLRAYNRKAYNGVEITEDGMGASLDLFFQAKRLGLRVGENPIEVSPDPRRRGSLLGHGLRVLYTYLRHLLRG